MIQVKDDISSELFHIKQNVILKNIEEMYKSFLFFSQLLSFIHVYISPWYTVYEEFEIEKKVKEANRPEYYLLIST